jgi:hypothetical protein
VKLSWRILDGVVPYTGLELRSGWVAAQTGLRGDAAAGFTGPCLVPTEHLVDLDDARAGHYIRAASMAHVIAEHPGCPLAQAVLRQRLLVCILREVVGLRRLERDGDDLYHEGRKLTVSIAAPAPGGSLIHLGINVDPTGAPVPAVGLEELKLDAVSVLGDLLERYAGELATMAYAETKVRRVP